MRLRTTIRPRAAATRAACSCSAVRAAEQRPHVAGRYFRAACRWTRVHGAARGQGLSRRRVNATSRTSRSAADAVVSRPRTVIASKPTDRVSGSADKLRSIAPSPDPPGSVPVGPGPLAQRQHHHGEPPRTDTSSPRPVVTVSV